jgi:hypothetical protein
MESKPKETYEEILARARRLNLTEARNVGLVSLPPDLRDANGRTVVVLSPGVLDGAKMNVEEFVDRMKCHVLLTLDGVSKNEYAVVLFFTRTTWNSNAFSFLMKEVRAHIRRSPRS